MGINQIWENDRLKILCGQLTKVQTTTAKNDGSENQHHNFFHNLVYIWTPMMHNRRYVN